MSEFKVDDIRNVLDKMDVSSARLRNKKHGRGICLEPTDCEVESDTKARAEHYISVSRNLAEMVHRTRSGLTEEELETVEFVREALLDLAKNNYVGLVR